MRILGYGMQIAIFWILLSNCILYPLFLYLVRKRRIQTVTIYIWLIIYFVELAFFVYIQQGLFTHVELGFAICLFISGFLLKPRHVIVFTVVSCVCYLAPVLAVHLGSPMIHNYYGDEVFTPAGGRVFAVAGTTVITLATIGIIVYWIMRMFGEWNKKILKDRNQLTSAQRRAQIGSWEYDPIHKVFSSSQEFRRIFGLHDNDEPVQIDELIDQVVVEEQRDEVKQFFKGIGRLQEKGRLEFQLSIPGHRDIFVWAEAYYDFDTVKNCIRANGIVQNVTRRKVMEEKLLKLAHYDELTGLANRVLFYDRIRQTLNMANREKRKFALMYLDLDGFKEVNDNYGHDIGDRLLKILAQRIEEALRGSDTVARMGGDEFAVILPDIKLHEDSTIAASKILSSMSSEVVIEGDVFTISASIGIAFYPQDSDSIEDLIKKADTAMYRAKQSGKNTYKRYDEKT